MADAYKTLYRGQLASSVATIYTAPSAAIIKHISVVNTDSAARTFALYRNGTTDPYAFTPVAFSLGAGEMAEWDGTMALTSGDTIAGVGSVASKLTTIIDGDEVS